MYLFIQTRKQILKEEGQGSVERYEQHAPGFAAYVELWSSDFAYTEASEENQTKHKSMLEELTKAGIKFYCFSDDCDWALMYLTIEELVKVKELFKKYNKAVEQ